MAKKKIKQIEKSNIEEKIYDDKKDNAKFSIPKNKVSFVLKMLFVAIFIFGFVRWIDSKRWFQTRESDVQFKIDCVEKLLNEKEMDIVFVGNSHSQTVDPFIISQSFKCNACVYSEPGIISDGLYYMVENLLEKQHPRLLCVETYSLLSERYSDDKNVLKTRVVDRIHSEYRKLKYVAENLNVEKMPLMLSRSLRNHEILFDSVLLNQGIKRENNNGIDPPYKISDEKYFYAKYGAIIYYATLSDSLMSAADSIGPLVDGEKFEFEDDVLYNVERIVKLCNEHNVPVLFYFVPIFHKVFANYEAIHSKYDSIFNKFDAKWIDFQLNCDTLLFGKNAYYDKEFKLGMHLNKYSMKTFTYMLANYINDSLDISFPDRSNTKQWKSDYLGLFDYPYISDVLENDTINKVILKNVEKDGVFVKEMFSVKNDKSDAVYAKVKKEKVDSLLRSMNKNFTTCYDYNLNKHLNLTIKCKMNGREMIGILPMDIVYGIRPIDHYVFKVDVVKGLDFTEILKIEIK